MQLSASTTCRGATNRSSIAARGSHVVLAVDRLAPTPPTRSPRLSVCIPTHHGRAGALDDLLSELTAQLADLGDDVEVCVSDNASQDATAAVVQAHRRGLGTRLRYRRNDRDLGVG